MVYDFFPNILGTLLWLQFILLQISEAQVYFGASESINWSKNIASPNSLPNHCRENRLRMRKWGWRCWQTDISLSESVPSSAGAKYAWELMGATIAPTWCYLPRQECSFWSPVCVYILITRVCLCLFVCFYADFDSSVCFPVHFTLIRLGCLWSGSVKTFI